MTVVCVGLSHREAPIAVREQLAVPDSRVIERLRELKALPGVSEALLLSTCNRLEIFAVTEGRGPGEDLLARLGPQAAPHARCRFDDEALRHLFRVAASLDSMVVGEAQILGQVKEAAARAQEGGTLGPTLGRAVARALSAAKRVRTETEIARGAVSISSVAVRLAKKLIGDLTGRCVLLLGAGEMGQLAARELKAAGAQDLLVANRSFAAAEELARQVGGVSVSFEELPQHLERADVLLCSTGAPNFVVTREAMGRALKGRRYRPIFLVDLALPRNVEPSANELENVYVYDLDDLESVAARNGELREAQVGRAEAIVEEELKALFTQARERALLPVLARLRAHAEAVARAEADRTLASLPLEEGDQKRVRAMAAAIVNKLLHAPTAKLRAEGAGPLAEAAAALFGLDPGTGPEPVPQPGPNPQPDPPPVPKPDTVLPFVRKG